jgi:hypothetical protein
MRLQRYAYINVKAIMLHKIRVQSQPTQPVGLHMGPRWCAYGSQMGNPAECRREIDTGGRREPHGILNTGPFCTSPMLPESNPLPPRLKPRSTHRSGVEARKASSHALLLPDLIHSA